MPTITVASGHRRRVRPALPERLARGPGVGAAMMFGTSLALIAQEFQGRERGTALGIWGGTTAAAVSIGPLVGGALVVALSWRWIFLVNVPIGLAALVVARLRLRETRVPAAAGVDVRGAAVLCSALFLLSTR